MSAYGEGFALGLRGVALPERLAERDFIDGWRAGHAAQRDDDHCAVCARPLGREVAVGPDGNLVCATPCREVARAGSS